MTKRTQQNTIPGTGTHRRTEGDYLAVLLDAVSLEDWREVVAETLRQAKAGDTQARAWLAQYLVGKPEAKAPTPMTVVVQQWSGRDPLAEKLAQPIIHKARYPDLCDTRTEAMERDIRAGVAEELARRLPIPGKGASEVSK